MRLTVRAVARCACCCTGVRSVQRLSGGLSCIGLCVSGALRCGTVLWRKAQSLSTLRSVCPRSNTHKFRTSPERCTCEVPGLFSYPPPRSCPSVAPVERCHSETRVGAGSRPGSALDSLSPTEATRLLLSMRFSPYGRRLQR